MRCEEGNEGSGVEWNDWGGFGQNIPAAWHWASVWRCPAIYGDEQLDTSCSWVPIDSQITVTLILPGHADSPRCSSGPADTPHPLPLFPLPCRRISLHTPSSTHMISSPTASFTGNSSPTQSTDGLSPGSRSSCTAYDPVRLMEHRRRQRRMSCRTPGGPYICM